MAIVGLLLKFFSIAKVHVIGGVLHYAIIRTNGSIYVIIYVGGREKMPSACKRLTVTFSLIFGLGLIFVLCSLQMQQLSQ